MHSQTLEGFTGYRYIRSYEIAIPYFMWKIDIDILCDKQLRLSEETVLGLVGIGIDSPKILAELMGFDDIRLISNVIVEMMRKEYISNNPDTGLFVSPLGSRVLQGEITKEPKHLKGMKIWYDPYRSEFFYGRQERAYKRKQAKDIGLHIIPVVKESDSYEVESRYKDVQRVVRENIALIEKTYNTILSANVDILQVRTDSVEKLYLPAKLDVWYNDERKLGKWRVLRGGVEDEKITDALLLLEREGNQIIPTETEDKQIEEITEQMEIPNIVQNIMDSTTELTTEWLTTDDHRPRLLRAINESNNDLVIISPWLNTWSVNKELRIALDDALKKNPRLKITIGYGIQPHTERPNNSKTSREDEAKNVLFELSKKYNNRLRMIEVGNTHQKIVICDDKYCIVSSFNFLSFNPDKGSGVREETGVFTRDTEKVVRLRKGIQHLLDKV